MGNILKITLYLILIALMVAYWLLATDQVNLG